MEVNLKVYFHYRISLRRGVADLEIDSLKSPTISKGIAEHGFSMSVEELISRGDPLLYRAKKLGKNRCKM